MNNPTWNSLRLASKITLVVGIGCTLISLLGCRAKQPVLCDVESYGPCQDVLQQIEDPVVCDRQCEDNQLWMTGPPPTIANFEQLQPWDMTLDEAVQYALEHNEVLSKLGSVVVSSPQAAATIYDPAAQTTDPRLSSEAALSAFDAMFTTSLFANHSERAFNNPFFGGGAASLISNTGNFNMALSKISASGTQYSVRNITDYDRNNSPVNTFPSVWNTVMQFEVRQPLLQGRGTYVNRIAGPNAVPGAYNGVLIARIREDVTLADFELAVKNLIRDVERSYWELYFAYRDLDTRKNARESARKTWENRKRRLEAEIGRPDEEAQARQQYFAFQTQVENALVGTQDGTGLLGAERQLRRVLGLPNTDGRIVRPASEPSLAPVIFDWNESLTTATQCRVEVRRQKWNVRQRELELTAARALNQMRVDFVANYGFRGFGDDLFGQNNVPNGSAFSTLLDGNLDDWQIGFEIQNPVGRRQWHLAERNAELQLCREQARLREQQRQIALDLNAAYAEVDRAFANIRSTYNNRVAIIEELEPKRRRVEAGEDDVFFLLDVQQRAANSESALHRSIIDYNNALLNFSYTNASLLSRYGITLMEGQWSNDAMQKAIEKGRRFSHGAPNCDAISNHPVSNGPLNQDRNVPPMQFAAPGEPQYGN
jgi:outer membrane protein TolC